MTKKKKTNYSDTEIYNNRDLSWLAFNERVLQEAIDPNVPVLEKIKFLSIFSSNLDEFFRVRVATIRRLIEIERNQKNKEGVKSQKDLLNRIQRIVVQQQERFSHIYQFVKEQLAGEKIFIISEKELNHEQRVYVRDYFKREVMSSLFPVILDHLREFPFLKDRSIYLGLKMTKSDGSIRSKYAMIEIPTDVLSRFYVLPKTDANTYIILLEDVVRSSLDMMFSSFEHDEYDAHIIKLTRDQELDIDHDMKANMVDKITKSLKKRDKGDPVRFIYDSAMPEDLLHYIIKKLKLTRDSLIPGGRYHNFKDFWNFPSIGSGELKYQPLTPVPVSVFERTRIMFDAIRERDIMLHHPYHSFDYVIRFLREAAIDPAVYAIKITLYRVARHSNIVNALINAVKNGKQVTAVIELQARFDEESNMYWMQKLQEAGANVVLGVPKTKVHSKICVIFRKENNKTVHYAHLSTGNYNGITSRSYSDLSLYTCDRRITQEVVKVFSLINNYPKINYKFNHLLVSPLYMKKEFFKLIDTEIKNAKKGKPAYIYAKMNSLSDEEVIDKLYDASKAGVKIRLIIRGICCLKPGVRGLSENIEIISIIDRFLEHARIFIFANGGNEKFLLGSADWMTRNLDHRIEVAFPVYDPQLQKMIREIMDLQWNDKVKARIIDPFLTNAYVPFSLPSIRAQMDTYNYFLEKYQLGE